MCACACAKELKAQQTIEIHPVPVAHGRIEVTVINISKEFQIPFKQKYTTFLQTSLLYSDVIFITAIHSMVNIFLG